MESSGSGEASRQFVDFRLGSGSVGSEASSCTCTSQDGRLKISGYYNIEE